MSSRWWAMPLESPAVISSKHCWRSSRKRRRAGKPKGRVAAPISSQTEAGDPSDPSRGPPTPEGAT